MHYRVADYPTFRAVLDQNGFASSAVNGPAVSSAEGSYMKSFDTDLASLGNVATHVTFHHYYGAGPEFTVQDYYSVSVLDSYLSVLPVAQTAAQPLTRCDVMHAILSIITMLTDLNAAPGPFSG